MEPIEEVRPLVGEADALVGEDGAIHARVGESIELTVAPGARRLVGGPPGMYVRRDGVVAYDLGADAAGRWDLEVRAPFAVRRLSLVVEGEGLVDGAPEPSGSAGGRRAALRTGCEVSLGAAGAWQTAGPGASPWRSLGPVSARRTTSPAALVACATDTPVAPVIAVEAVPLWTLREHGAPLATWLGVQAAGVAWRVGGYATFGDWGFGSGARVARLDPRFGGPELRVGWIPPQRPRDGVDHPEAALTGALAWSVGRWW